MLVDGVTVELFDRLPLVAIMRKDNELAEREHLSRSELGNQKLCFLSEDEGPLLNKHFVESFRACGFENLFIDTTATMESVIMIIESKGYLTVAPECVMENRAGTIVTVPMVGDDEFVYQGGAWRTDIKNPAVKEFVDLAKEQFDAMK